MEDEVKRGEGEYFQEKCCGYCAEASTYDEDRYCWCHRHNCNVDEFDDICDYFDKDC